MTPGEQAVIGARREYLDRVDSTNRYLRDLAARGAPHGLAVIAREQTAGRGRFGRSFQSARDRGLYLSVLLRPDLPAAQAPLLTPWTAVAVCRAVEAITPLHPQIKWMNDILLDGRKLCGILAEADITPTGKLNWVILGIGINISQQPEDFPPELSATAASLAMHLPTPPDCQVLIDALLTQLDRMWRAFPQQQEAWLAAYRDRCVTPGQAILVHTPQGDREGVALAVDESFALVTRFADGTIQALNSGEVSVRKRD